MTERADRRREARLGRLAQGAAAAAMLVGAVVLVGWASDLELAKSGLSTRVTMKPNTALGLLLAGASLRLLGSRPPIGWRRSGALACALAIAAVGLLTLGEYLLGRDAGIDQLLFREPPGAVDTSAPGRMAPATALGVAMLGAGLLLLDAKLSAARWLSQLLLVTTVLVGLLGLARHLYEVKQLHGVAVTYTVMAVHTAAALIALSVGALLARLDRGIGAVLASRSPGGVMARRLWPAGVAIPLALGWIRLQGERAGYYGSDFGLALFALANAVVFAALVWWSAVLLNRTDTERRRAEIEVRRLNRGLEARVDERTAELAAANRELESFAYSVSHDLRAPLRHLDGFARMLLEREAERLDATSRRWVETICQAAARMGRLIDDLLRFSRMSRSELQRRPVDLTCAFEEARRELEPAIDGRSISWAIGPLPVVEADPGLLRIVFVNLLANAIKFTAPRAEARIEVSAAGAAAGGTSGGAVGVAGGEAVISVRDNGVGFDAAYAHKLFGVFQRLHRDDEFPGTGIGLATVQRIIHRHGGRVWAESEVGRGAAFYFTMKTVGRQTCS